MDTTFDAVFVGLACGTAVRVKDKGVPSDAHEVQMHAGRGYQ